MKHTAKPMSRQTTTLNNQKDDFSIEFYWALVSIAFLGVIVTYWKSFWYPFIFDDAPTIVQNFLVNHGSVAKIFNAHSRWVSVLINHLTATYYSMNPFYFRMVNLIMHGGLGFIIFYLMRQLLSELDDNEWAYAYKNSLASLTAIFFLLHPVQTQTAVYITQMRLEGLVLWTTVLLLICLRNLHHNQTTIAWIGWYSIAGILCFIAAGTKEIMIVIPFLVGITEYTFFSQGNIKKWATSMLMYLPLFIILYGTFLHFSRPFSLEQVLTFNIHLDNNRGNILTNSLDQKISSFHFLSGQFRIMMHYIRIFFWPTGLTFDYGWKLPNSWFELTVLGNLAALVLLWAYLFTRWLKNKSDVIVWGMAWFFIALLPRTSIIPTAELVCDYKTYVSSLGMMMILAYFFLKTLQFITKQINNRTKKVEGIICATVVGLMMYASHDRNKVWSGELSFWSDVIEKQENKSARVYNNYAAALHAAGIMPKAIETLYLSAAADPTYAEPLINLGICAANGGRDDEAIQYYEKAVSFLHEPHQEAFANLAHLYTKKNMLEKAFYTVIPALQLNPYYTVAWEVLAQIYERLGFPAGAAHARGQAQNRTDTFDLERHFAAAYFFKNNIPDALTLLEKVITYDDSFFYNFMAGSCYYQQARYEKALPCFEVSYKQNPTHVGCSYNLAMTYLNLKKFASAYPLFESLLPQEGALPYVSLQYAKCAFELGKKEIGNKTITHILTNTSLPDPIKQEASELQKLAMTKIKNVSKI